MNDDYRYDCLDIPEVCERCGKEWANENMTDAKPDSEYRRICTFCAMCEDEEGV